MSDLEDPFKVICMYKFPLIVPELYHGMILEQNGKVKIYCGATDTVECLATAHVDDMIRLCFERK